MAKWKQYPKADKEHYGCKVGWLGYTDKAKAEKAAKAARNNAEIQWAAGYDFGYCSPGSVETPESKLTKWPGLYTVCIP